mgnify:CR=1 FL=1
MNTSKRDARLLISCGVVVAALVIFTAVRIAIWGANAPLFADLSAAQIGSAFLNGCRFDFYMTALCLGPVLFLLNLPIKSVRWVQGCSIVLLAELVFLTGFLIADFVYFPKVGRHIAEEIIQISADWGYVVSYAFKELWWALLLLIGGFIGAVYFLCRWIHQQGLQARSIRKTIFILLIILAACALGIRGHLGRGKSLGVADVYKYANTASGAALTLNGAFTAYQVGRKGSQEFTNTFPVEQAILNTQKLIISPAEEVLSEQYPLERKRTVPAAIPGGQQPNILIVLLEGWHPYYVDGISHHGFGATPVFDDILKNGIQFTNAYAAGQRSIFGFAAVLAGVPFLPGLPMFGYGLEMTELSPLPRHFAQNGYYTFFAQTSHRDSYRLCALASYLGMQDSFGWEDIPQRLPYREKAPFGYDYDAFQFAADKIQEHTGQPFLGMVFTGITHEPFASTLPQFDKYPYDSWEHGFLNTLAFADWSLGELLARAQQDGWLDDTIFVFVADHTSGGPAENTLKNHFRIPLVIYAPKRFKPQRVEYVVSQLDLGPTLYNLAGLTPAYTTLGRDMLDKTAPHWALVAEGNNLGLITAQGAVRHTGSQLLTVEKQTENFDAAAAEETLLSVSQAAYTLLKENRWYTSAENGETK